VLSKGIYVDGLEGQAIRFERLRNREQMRARAYENRHIALRIAYARLANATDHTFGFEMIFATQEAVERDFAVVFFSRRPRRRIGDGSRSEIVFVGEGAAKNLVHALEDHGLRLARRLVEAGTRVVEVIWPKVANSDNHSWDHHVGLTDRMKTKSGPMLDQGLAAFIEDMDSRGLLDETLVVAIGEFGRSPQKGVSTSGNGNSADGRDHWPYCYTALIAGAGVSRGALYGRSDATGSSPADSPVHPTQIVATIYHALGIDPHTIVMNHLNQPRELVQAEPVLGLFS